MPNVPFQVGDGIQIGAAVITASGAAIVLPANTSVGGTQVATSTDVSTGGGPKITNLQITDNSWTVLDDTAVDTAGGYILITGTNFVSGALVYFNQTPATSVAFVDTTSLRITVPALTAGTYIVYVINPDGGTAIRVPGLTASANPAWQTGSALPEQYDGVAITLNLVATDATSYTITSGSLPPGLSLNTSTGAITGTVTGVSVDTTYTFTVRATDAQLQDSPRTFTVTVAVSDAYFKLTTLLLSGSAIPVNTVIKDSSTNNFNLTVSGDARASNFTPYGGAWSVYFDGTGDYLSFADSAAFDLAINNFTIECWVYTTSFNSQYNCLLSQWDTSLGYYFYLTSSTIRFGYQISGSNLFTEASGLTNSTNTWIHLAVVRNSNSLTIYKNGTSVGSGSITGTINNSSNQLWISGLGTGSGALNNTTTHFGYISNIRLVNGTALYTANFTPATTNLTSVANTSILTCHANRFLDGSTNNFAITRNGDARIVSFNPFNITNTGVNGSAYFDGTGDYLSLVDASNNLDITALCSFETWVYPFSTSGVKGIFMKGGGNNSWSTTNGIYYDLLLYNNNFYSSYNVAGTGGSIGESNTRVPYQWYHVVLAVNGTTISIFVNGLRVATGTATVTQPTTRTTYWIGNTFASEYFQGYMSEVRYVTGAGAYNATQTTITVPTAPLTAIANTQLLTLQYDQPHNNHTFLDSSSNQFLITRNGNATQGTFSPFSPAGWSVYINNGTSSQIRISDNAALRIGTSAFNIEAWVYPTGFGEPFYVLRKRVNGNLGAGTWAFTVATNGSVLLEQVQGPATIAQTSAGLVALNTWTHVAVSRDSSNNVRIFVNGTIQATATSSYNFNDASNPISLLCDYDGRNASSIGYASNLRFVIGSAVYTANFTPATSNLTSSSQGAVAADVKILTFQDNRFRDASTNNFSITISGSPSVQAFSPFAPTAVYNPVTHGGSAYFDRTGDFLSLATNNSFDFGTGNFTVELFYYPLAYDDIQMFFSGTSNYQFGYSATDSRNLYYYGSSGNVISGTPAASMLLNQWNHIVLVRSGTSLAIMSNGVRQGTATHSSSVNFSGSPIVGGYADSTASYAIRGYMAGFRVVKGVAMYDPTQTTYTVPAAPVTATANTSLLLNFTDAAILDSTGRNVLETVADVKSSSVVTKFTGGSIYFDGTGDYLAIPAASWQTLGTSNFTCEWWEYIVAYSSGYFVIIHLGSLGDTGNFSSKLGLRYELSGTRFRIGVAGTSLDFDGLTTATGVWRHCVLVRNGNSWNLYQNGVAVGGTITNSVSVAASTSTGIIGAAYFGGGAGALYSNNGYITDLRFTVGHARYTANFTLPTAPARLK